MITFRPFKKCDGQIVVSWIGNEEVYYRWCAGHIGTYPVTTDMLIEYSKKVAEDPRAFWMVACEDERPFGFMQFRYPTPENDVIRIGYILVEPELRGKGYGKRLMNLAVKYSFDFLSVRKITLGVFEDNLQAFRAYSSVGFILTKSTHSYEIMGETKAVNEMVMYSPQAANSSTGNMETVEENVREVFKNNSFRYAFQPIVDAVTGDIYGYEALMRAENEGISIPPSDVIGYAKRHKRLYDVEKATFFNVFDAYENNLSEFGERKIFINSIPGFQLSDSDYAALSEKYGKYFGNTVVEVTEMTELKDSELGILLGRSSSGGFGLAIDDYGTGYSNTASLLSYLPDCVKLDRLLISNINEDTKKQHFVKGMVEFAHANGFKLLAEGVETSAELASVISIGVDLIQGYYTARPSFEILDEVDSDVRNEIVNVNSKNQTTDTRKIYVVTDEEELPLMRLSLSQYTGILVARPDFTLVGNMKYCADMSVKIKEGIKCRLTIKDVFIESPLQLPCIELGSKSDVTLVIKGVNRIRKMGILVPKDAKLTIEGDGDLVMRVQGIKSYGIGNDYDGTFGNITWKGTGALDIVVEADNGIGIGGGKASEESAVAVLGGTVRTESACSSSVSIGCVYDTVPITIENVQLRIDMKTDNGIGIGCGGIKQNILIHNSEINITGAGAVITAIGSNSDDTAEGKISFSKTDLIVMANGQKLALVGAKAGKLNVDVSESTLSLKGEGNEVVALGTFDKKAVLTGKNSTVGVKIGAGTPVPTGATEENTFYMNVKQVFSVNE